MPDTPTAAAAAERIRAGELTPEALVEACLARIEEVEGAVHAWTVVDAEGARAAARGDLPDGPLHGVPVGVKDILDTAGLATGYGSPLYAGHRPVRDAAAVARLRAAGAVVLGKTVSTEFALFTAGATCNPHALDHSPGGSSSGSAAAVAAGMVPVALGTQTAGSIIRPATFCGVVGYKPTSGWVSRAGCLAVCESLDTIGAFARTVDDVALTVGVMAGRDLGNPPSGPPEQPVVGLYRTPVWERVVPEVRRVVERCADDAVAAGAKVVEVEALDDYAAADEAHHVVMAYEMVRELAHEWTAARAGISDNLRDRLERAARVSAEDYDDALAVTRTARAQAAGRLAGFDALLTPATPDPAPARLNYTGDPSCNRVWTLLGTPSLHLPLDRTEAGLPLGVQLVGAPSDDRRLLATGRWLARALGADTAAVAGTPASPR